MRKTIMANTVQSGPDRRGFTLLELLIASSIFAMIMILVVGVLGQTSSYQSKIYAMRSVSEETRKLADQITRDVRAANGAMSIKKNSSDAAAKTYKNGIALFNCSVSACTSPYDSDAALPYSGFLTSSSVANTLVLVKGGEYTIYWSSADKIYFQTGAVSSPLILTGTNSIIPALGADRVISANETKINFAGFTPSDNVTTHLQPYTLFYISSQTPGYAASPSKGYQTELRSMVTGRSYN